MSFIDDIARAVTGSQAQHHHFHFHNHNEPESEVSARLCEIEKQLSLIKEIIMSSFDDLKAAQAETDSKIATIKTDVETMLVKLAAIPAAGLTPEQQSALDDAVAHAQAMNASLAAVDAAVNPAPAATPAT